MELKDYLKILKKSWLTILIVAVIFAALGYLKAKKDKPTTQAFVTFQVSQKPEVGTNFRYDNYYNLSASSVLVDQISGLAASPNLVMDVYDKAGTNLPENDARKLAKAFRVQKPSGGANNVTVTATDEEKNIAIKLADTLKSEITQRVSDLQDKGQLSDSFQVTNSNVNSLTSQSDPLVSIVAFALTGFIVGSAGALLKDYLT